MRYVSNFSGYLSESIYSAAARIADPKFSKPATNNEYKVKSVKITFPDTTQLLFDIVHESYYSDKINYSIRVPYDDNNRELRLHPQNSIQALYIKAFGDCIQMENYEEYVFVRCWNTPEDFSDHNWNGYIFNGNKDGMFNEIAMRFIILPSDYNEQIYPGDYFRNNYMNKNTISVILTNYVNQISSEMKYSKLMELKRKFESYLLNIDESKNIDLIDTKIDNISLSSLIYALSLKDGKILKNSTLYQDGNLRSCKPSKLIDTLFK
jgi:hypothetical protein